VTTIDIDGYRFSGTDVRRTLLHACDLLDLYPAAVRPFQTPRRERMSAAVADGDITAVWREVLAARDDAVASGLLPATATGVVEQVSASGGGVPKLALERAEVDLSGVVGDRQAARVHHGRPWQALCIWSSEVIAALVAEGHQIGPGSAGENITVTGLDWRDVQPGVRLRIGSVLCQVTAYAVPCAKNAHWFHDRDFSRIHHSRGPMSRVYAVVLEPGSVRPGDAAVLEPT
jgi:MOSC domain-containing protein YiiM